MTRSHHDSVPVTLYLHHTHIHCSCKVSLLLIAGAGQPCCGRRQHRHQQRRQQPARLQRRRRRERHDPAAVFAGPGVPGPGVVVRAIHHLAGAFAGGRVTLAVRIGAVVEAILGEDEARDVAAVVGTAAVERKRRRM